MRLDIYDNPSTTDILAAIGLDESKIPRIRGVGIEDGKILIHTRTGGGNRESYGDIESYIKGDYGIDSSINDIHNSLKTFEGYCWHIYIEYDIDTNDRYKPASSVPYEATYRYPETEDEWSSKEAEIRNTLTKIETQKAEVLATGAYTNEYLTRNKYYILDEDDDFDSTYANFWFMIPQEHVDKLLPLEDPVRRAALGNAKDYIEAVFGDDSAAKQRIINRINDAESRL